MALTATIYNFDVELSDTDRHVYETLALRVARHPSESEEYLIARVIAYLLEFAEGIEFSRGISTPDEPAIAVRDLTGAIKTWIDVGTPDAARLHKAAKLAARVAVYTHKDPAQFLKQLTGKTIHNADALELYAIDRNLVVRYINRTGAEWLGLPQSEIVDRKITSLNSLMLRTDRTSGPSPT